ncbi:MAG TPA: response regulator, partial [Thermoanaerobaculaceae bacterium]|nr:response regulator [Thermoanaerobaculaceae bacterium]
PRVDIAEVEPAALATGKGERVLVVEDEPAARQGLLELLEVLGYEAVAVGSGGEAGHAAASSTFDLLLTDLMLPDVSGADLAVTLSERWPEMKVILMSGYAEDEYVRLRAFTGVVRFLQKPFDVETLARELRAALGGEGG